MTPHQVKLLAVDAAMHDDHKLALTVCKAIADQDLYLNVPQPQRPSAGRVITMQWPDRPCKGSCGQLVLQGSEAWWQPGWGVSHLECKQ